MKPCPIVLRTFGQGFINRGIKKQRFRKVVPKTLLFIENYTETIYPSSSGPGSLGFFWR
jgi:hypothetical protein